MTEAGHIIIAGAGVIGLSVARQALQRGFKVTCVAPRRENPVSASSAAGAMLGAFGEITRHPPHDASNAETQMRIESARLYPSWLEEVQYEADLKIRKGRGTIIVANSASREDSANLAAIEASASMFGESVEHLDPHDCADIAPHPNFTPTGLLFLANEGYVNSHDLLVALKVANTSREAYQYIDDEIVDIREAPSKVRLRSGKSISGDHIVLACSSAVSRLLEDAAITDASFPRIVKGKGSYVILERQASLPYVVRTPNRDFACGLHLVPRGERQIYLGATNRVELDDDFAMRPSLAELQSLMYNAAHQFDVSLRRASFIEAGSGGRPYSLDGKMVLGALEGRKISVVTGTYRNGVLLAPLLAAAIVEEIETGKAANSAFSPKNRRTKTLSADEVAVAIDRAFADLIAYVLEPNGFLPFDRQQQISHSMRSMFMALMSDGDERRAFKKFQEAFERTYAPDLIPYLFEKYAAPNKWDGS